MYDGQDRIDVTLLEDIQSLDEVVVVGYGSLSRRELSSSIVQVDRSDFQPGAVGNPMELLTGKVAGLNVNNTARPILTPAHPSRLRRHLHFGIKRSADSDRWCNGGNIRNLSPQDIESMTVLKDAASAAIYGTRGANGVIL